jgi:hypothetical protein
MVRLKPATHRKVQARLSLTGTIAGIISRNMTPVFSFRVSNRIFEEVFAEREEKQMKPGNPFYAEAIRPSLTSFIRRALEGTRQDWMQARLSQGSLGTFGPTTLAG